jgi:hypothetical protein
MRVNRFLMPIIVIVALLGTTLIAQAAGFWSTSGKDSTDLENMSAADIKGWMTLQQVMDGLKISQEELYGIGGIPLDIPPETALKDLEGVIPDFEISTLREKLAAPANPIESTPLPQPTVTPQPITGTHSGDGTGLGLTPLPSGQVLPAD